MIFTRPGCEEREIVASQRVKEPSYGLHTRTSSYEAEQWYATMGARDWNHRAEIARWRAQGYSSTCPECSHPVSEHTSMLNATCTHENCYCRWWLREEDQEPSRLERHVNAAEYWLSQADIYKFPDPARTECLQLAATHAALANALRSQP